MDFPISSMNIIKAATVTTIAASLMFYNLKIQNLLLNHHHGVHYDFQMV